MPLRPKTQPSKRQVGPVPIFANDNDLAGFLNEAMQSIDSVRIAVAIGQAVRAKGVSLTARTSGLRRENLHRLCQGERSVKLETVLRVLAAIGMQLSVAPRAALQREL